MDLDSPESNLNTTRPQQVPSPDLFSSEDEDNDKTDDPPQLPPPFNDKNLDRTSGSHDLVQVLESSRLHRLMELLQGVPPPPSVTIPQISLTEVLNKWKENFDLTDVGSHNNSDTISSLWKPSASLEEVLNSKWPDVTNIIYHDMHFNSCTASEDVELYSMKLHERFIGAETSSWCNAVTSSKPNSAKKRQRLRVGNTSPGCRLSHLARRRQFFSSANLAQLSSVAGSGTAGGAPAPGGNLSGARRPVMNGAGGRRIMVEIKKTDKNKRIKTNSKEAMSRLPLVRNVPKSVSQVQSPVQATKRALFQSPEEQKRIASLPRALSTSETNSVQRSKRVLWPSDKEALLNENGKRSLSNGDSSSSQRSKIHCSDDRVPYNRTTRSLPFSLGHNSTCSIVSSNSNSSQLNTAPNSGVNKTNRRASDQGPSASNSCGNLSELHKRKLFWAITTALRDIGIVKNNADFASLAQTLALHYIEVKNNMTGPAPTSTSEHMLKVVSSKVGEVIQAYRASKTGQEENLGSSKMQKKEERSNKELFRDATASLNVRRSLCVSLSSSSVQPSDNKPKQTKRVPSARKSLSFDSIDPKTSSGTLSDEPVEKCESKYQLDSKGNDNKRRCNGENVPLASAKRVSRSLFLSPKDEIKAAKKDASEQTCASDTRSSTTKNTDEASDQAGQKNQVSSSMSNGKPNGIDNCYTDDRLQPTSEVSSIPSVSAVSSTLEADNEASETSEATTLSELANSIDTSSNLASSINLQPKDNDELEGPTLPIMITDNVKTDSASSESCEYIPTRILRGTRERVARLVAAQLGRTRKSLSLSKRELRSSSTDSVDPEPLYVNQLSGNSDVSASVVGSNMNDTAVVIPQKLELKISLSPTKVASPIASTESTTSRSAFGSPSFISENVCTALIRSPFLGFPPKEEYNLSGGALSLIVDGSDSILKVPVIGEGSCWLDTTLTPKPDVSSEDGNISQSDSGKLDLEEKVITPLLEAAVLESSVCVGSGSSHSTDADLTFRGRIESLKPSNVSDSALSIDLGLNLNVSANILNMDENKEKSPVLEKWAERASRSAQKNCASSDGTIEPVIHNNSVPVSGKSSENSVEESMLPWDESQLLDGASQCSTNMFEKFRSIFDSSSHQDNS